MAALRDEILIERMGREGDGLARITGAVVPVPGALPGERVRLDPLEIVKASSDRVEPPCRHFQRCGNCVVQHWRLERSREWKREIVRGAFRREGIEVEPEETFGSEPGTRRRVTFTATRDGERVRLGYHERRSDDVVAVEECPVALPRIVEALPSLERAAELAMRGGLQVHVVASEAGLDVALRRGAALPDDQRRALVAHAVASGWARVSLDGEVLAESEAPTVPFGNVKAFVPVDGFLQATQPSEDAMAALVLAHLAKSKRIADLFCGAGTFALRLAHGRSVTAFESDAAALETLARSAAKAERSVGTRVRDLAERPVPAKELDAFDGLVLDPPRAGAGAQAVQIARSRVERVAYVSCHPATLARDAKVLTDGGYALERVVPIDQFVWSAHVEAVALFAKPKRKRERRLFG